MKESLDLELKNEFSKNDGIRFSKFSRYFLDISEAFLHTSNPLPHSFTSLIILYGVLRSEVLKYCTWTYTALKLCLQFIKKKLGIEPGIVNFLHKSTTTVLPWPDGQKRPN